MNEYNYETNKEKLMELQIENPNPLPIHYVNGLKTWIYTKYKLTLDDEGVKELHDYFEAAKIVYIGVSERESKDLSYTMFDGKIERFNKSGSDFIRAMVGHSAELRIRIMYLRESEMETYIEDARKSKAKEFSEFFKNKEYESRETGEPVNWEDIFQDFYYLYDFPKAITTTQIVNSIKSGKMKLATAETLMELMLEEVFIKNKNE